jgi:putative peptidoglycan lipid II flippase
MVALLAERPRTGPQAVGRPEPLSDSGWVRRLRDRREPADEAESEVPAGDERTVSADRLPRPMSMNRSALPPVPPPSAPARPGVAGRWPVEEGESDLDWSSTFTGEDRPSADPEEPSVRRRLAVVGLPLLALVLVVAFAVWFGKNVLSVASSVNDTTGSTPPATASASPSAGPPATAPTPTSASPSAPAPPVPASIAGAAVFDPYGDGASENGRQVPLSHDGNPVTTWSTVTYRGSADFGRLKPGVGIRYDLGDPQQLTGVTIATVQPGTTVEVRTADSAGGSLADYPVAATARLTGSDQLTFAAPVTARYLLVWVTGLVATGDGFTGSLAEVTPLKAG